MKRLNCLWVGFALLCPASASAQAADTASPTVRASGTATVSVRPTLASITFTMSTTNPSASRAGAEVAATADTLRAALAALGIPRDSLVSGSRWRWWRGRLTTNVSRPYCEDPNVAINRCDLRQDTTYTVQDRVEARISNFEVLGDVIDEALRLGITEMSDFQFSTPSQVEAEDRALAEATSRARRRAEIMAEALRSALGRLRVISTEAPSPGVYGLMPVSLSTQSYSAGRTEVIAPTLTISVTVFGTWDLKEPGAR